MNKYGLFPSESEKDAMTNEMEAYISAAEDHEKA